MQKEYDMVISISADRAEVKVEQFGEHGVISRKNLAPDTLSACFYDSRRDDEAHPTGMLPDNCIAARVATEHNYYFIRHPELREDVSYYGTEYLKFPLPRLVFGFKYLKSESKVVGSRVCVVPEGRLSSESELYTYPFSNVDSIGGICMGNNALPAYKDPARLSTLPGFILRIPNNNDRFNSGNNLLKLEYRDLLEYMKDKEPSHYYTDVLKKSGRTLKQFLEWR